MNSEELTSFLLEAKKRTYAIIDQAVKTILPDGATELIHSDENLIYRDRYYGGEPYAGEEVVFLDHSPIWVMNYYGKILNQEINPSALYGFLQKALRNVKKDLPLRGPKCFEENEFKYNFEFDGKLECFTGMETISLSGVKCYQCNIHGGFVNITT